MTTITDKAECTRCGGSGFYSNSRGQICYECAGSGKGFTRGAKRLRKAAEDKARLDDSMPPGDLAVGAEFDGKIVAAIVGEWDRETGAFAALIPNGTATVIAADGSTSRVHMSWERISRNARWNGLERRFTPKRKAAAIRRMLAAEEFAKEEWAAKAARRR